MFALFGEMFFQALNAPEAFRSSSQYSYGEHNVLEAPPRLQWLANDLQKISLVLGFNVAFVNPQTQMNLLRAAAEDHQARALVFGNGIHRGYFVIEEIEETHHQLADDGSYIAISARVELREWVPGADFDPFAPPRRSLPPPGIVSNVSPNPPASVNTLPAAFDPSQPIGATNQLPTSAIVQLSSVGAEPGVTYSPAVYSQPGVSGVAAVAPSNLAPTVNFGDVPASSIVRAG